MVCFMSVALETVFNPNHYLKSLLKYGILSGRDYVFHQFSFSLLLTVCGIYCFALYERKILVSSLEGIKNSVFFYAMQNFYIGSFGRPRIFRILRYVHNISNASNHVYEVSVGVHASMPRSVNTKHRASISLIFPLALN